MRRTRLQLVLALSLGLFVMGCNSTPTLSGCESACTNLLPCLNVSYAYSCGAQFCGYGYQYESASSGGTEFNQCVSGCQALPTTQQSQIVQCVMSASSCVNALSCE